MSQQRRRIVARLAALFSETAPTAAPARAPAQPVAQPGTLNRNPRTPAAARLAANRANAQRSSGPATAAGKARSSANAVAHGLFCRRLLVHSASLQERPDEFDALHQDYRNQFRPQGRRESDLVEKICANEWRRLRFIELEGVALQRLERESGLAGLERFLRGASGRQSALASISREVRLWTRDLEQAQTRRTGKSPQWVDPLHESSEARFAVARPAGFVAEPAPAARAPAAPPRDETDVEYAARMNREDPQPSGYKWTRQTSIVSISERPELWADDPNPPPLPLKGWPDHQPFPKKFRHPRPYPGQPEPDWPPGSREAKAHAALRALLAQPPLEPDPAAPAPPAPATEPERRVERGPEDSGVLVTLGGPSEPEPW